MMTSRRKAYVRFILGGSGLALLVIFLWIAIYIGSKPPNMGEISVDFVENDKKVHKWSSALSTPTKDFLETIGFTIVSDKHCPKRIIVDITTVEEKRPLVSIDYAHLFAGLPTKVGVSFTGTVSCSTPVRIAIQKISGQARAQGQFIEGTSTWAYTNQGLSQGSIYAAVGNSDLIPALAEVILQTHDISPKKMWRRVKTFSIYESTKNTADEALRQSVIKTP
jgi:hypothetical protein